MSSESPSAPNPTNPIGGSVAIGDQVQSDRQRLLDAQANGKVLGTYVKLSGPGWLQSAITLGGGSLAGSLFLGVLGGTQLLWLQLVAITMGVVMLSAISYVTLSTGRRPFEAIKHEINPALAWGWLIATAMANMIWCMPQFSLAYDALDKNLFALVGDGTGLGDGSGTKWMVTAFLFAGAAAVVLLNVKQGKAAKLFDVVLKTLIGMIVICFFGVVVLLAAKGQLDFGSVLAGLVPNLSTWSQPTGMMAELIAQLPDDAKAFWTQKIVSSQQEVMIAAAATAVGINMTFLLPYSMLARGWDKPFRGLARFDLSTGMAIPYVLVTSCVVIAAAASFHGKADDAFLSNDPAVFQTSALFKAGAPNVAGRLGLELAKDEKGGIQWTDEQLTAVAAVSETEKRVAAGLIKRNAFQLSQTLAPLLGESWSKLIFGLGVLGMGFSTIIILMLINGYVFREMLGDPNGTQPFVIGCLVAGLSGACWVLLWTGNAKFYGSIIASTFGSMLLPIAYITFFLMMNSKRILGEEKPTGLSMVAWNVLMGVSIAGSIVAAFAAIRGKMDSSPDVFWLILGLLVVFGGLVAWGFTKRAPVGDAA